jgi:putative SOS response-associated peptidase YedK
MGVNMCGRFSFAVDLEELRATFPWLNVQGQVLPRYNIAPTQQVPAVVNDGLTTLTFLRWGLIPSWAKDVEVGNRMINARAETLADKPSFRSAYRQRRCLILASGFYEWKKEPAADEKGRKTPLYIRLKSGKPFAFAGLWESWKSPDGGAVLSCTIITTAANELLMPVHDRMPVILPPETYPLWLDPAERQPEELNELLRPYPASEVETYAVSTLVNDPRNDVPACLAPV